ncbi:CLEC3A [Mytilus coruscus]|uniref:CLEC3A n=1 Tax=Mytilus coruscus TaxID=42192 RepID=A0A6J8D5N9_MYTCO|nr:CLEC3A [Mytilus coruscus]
MNLDLPAINGNTLYMVVLTVVFVFHSTCVGRILPQQIPGQVIQRQIIPVPIILEQDQIELQQNFFLIDERGTSVDGTGIGTRSGLQLLPLPLITLAVPMMSMAMAMMMTSTVTSGTTVAPTTVPATTQTAAQTIAPCVPTNCPDGYALLNNQAVSPNCYFYSGTAMAMWSTAQKTCTLKGAYLWRPKSEAEANAVKDEFKFGRDEDIWTGANSPTHDENFLFVGDNSAFSFTNLPFGIPDQLSNDGCVEIEVNMGGNWEWDDDPCSENHRYICEFPTLSMVVLTVVFISQSSCVAQNFPGQIPEQIIPRQVITSQDQVEQQQDFFLIDEGGTTVDGTGIGTGSALQTALQLFPIALLTLAVPMMAMARTSISGTTVAPTTATVTVPTTQTATPTTPCVPTNCPDGYVLLNDQAVSPNCYLYSGTSKGKWYYAMKKCTMKGAYLWRPNSEAEANAVKDNFQFGTDDKIWTGANSPGHDGNFVFAVENSAFSLTSLPFGEFDNFDNNDCVEISLNNQNVWKWNDEDCLENYLYICEFPRNTCP